MTARPTPRVRAASRTRAMRGAWAETTTGRSASRRSLQTLADPCGSRSITTATPAASSCAIAKPTAMVVFPAPPF